MREKNTHLKLNGTFPYGMLNNMVICPFKIFFFSSKQFLRGFELMYSYVHA